MQDSQNPYQAPASKPADAVVDEKRAAKVASLARGSAQVFLAYACLLPLLRPLQAYNLLAPYGAEDKVAFLLLAQLQHEGPWLVALSITAILIFRWSNAIRRGQWDHIQKLRLALGWAIALDLATNAISLQMSDDDIRTFSEPLIVLARCAWLGYLIRMLNQAEQQ